MVGADQHRLGAARFEPVGDMAVIAQLRHIDDGHVAARNRLAGEQAPAIVGHIVQQPVADARLDEALARTAGRGYNYSILLMMAAPFVLAAAFGGILYLVIRKPTVLGLR